MYYPVMQTSVEAQLAALQPAVETPGPLQFALNFLWLEKNVAIAVDQLFDQVGCCLCFMSSTEMLKQKVHT